MFDSLVVAAVDFRSALNTRRSFETDLKACSFTYVFKRSDRLVEELELLVCMWAIRNEVGHSQEDTVVIVAPRH